MDAPIAHTFTLTYAPGYNASGTPVDPNPSRQALRERREQTVDAPNADQAVGYFERTTDRMVTQCERAR